VAQTDTYRELARLRAECPISQPRPGLHFVTSYAAAAAVLTNEVAFSARHVNDGPIQTRPLLQLDGPHHNARRRIVARAIGARHVLAARPSIELRSEALVRRLIERRGGDLVAELAVPLTTSSIADFVGLAHDQRDRVFGWVVDILHDDRDLPERIAGRGARAARADFHRFITAEIERRRGQTVHTDALGRLLEPDPETGISLTGAEVVTHARNLCQAANGATTLLIGNVVYELLRAPDLYQRLKRDRSMTPTAIEESLRHDPPNNFTRRVCTAPLTLEGTSIAVGEEITVSLASTNRDGSRFSNGEDFRLDQGRPPGHLAFGWGTHYCIGAFLARTMAASALQAIVEQDQSPRLAPGFQYERQPGLAGLTRRGPHRLDVIFDDEY